MHARGKRRTTRAWDQLELLGPRPRLPQWSELPESVQREVMRLLARLLRAASGTPAGGPSGEVGDE